MHRYFALCLGILGGLFAKGDISGNITLDGITCPEGYEIYVYFDDCTGYCVPNGTAQNPISSSGCVSPNEPQVGSLELEESSATIEMLMGEGDDSYCERWNLTRSD